MALNTRLATALCSVGILASLNIHGLAAASSPVPPNTQSAPAPQLRPTFSGYILGPGDAVQVELLDVPEYSGVFSIGPDGTLYLPRLRSLYVEGLSVDELRYFLEQQLKTYVKQPDVYVRPVTYRPVRVYLGGEVRRPGYYLLSGQQILPDAAIRLAGKGTLTPSLASPPTDPATQTPGIANADFQLRQPTLFDAIRAGQGATPYSNLAEITVTRKQPVSAGGGRIRANLNLLSLLTDGDESQNIRLYDGDVVVVSRSSEVLRDQLLKAADSNLSPDTIEVFVTGRVRTPGPQVLPQGASLNQALMAAGGPKLLRGGVDFVRFNRDGSTDRRSFSYQPSAGVNTFQNPLLQPGDVIRVNDSVLSAGVEVLNEVTGPVLSLYSLYRIFQ